MTKLFYLYILHIAIVGLFIFGLFPSSIPLKTPFDWINVGRDNYCYWQTALDLISGQLIPTKCQLGFPILLLPIAAIFPSHDVSLPLVVFFWTILAFPFAQWLLYKISGNFLSVLIWTLLPLAAFAGLKIIGDPFAEIQAFWLTWAQMLSDGPATLLTLMSVFLFLKLRKENYSMGGTMFLGVILGFLGLVRLTGFLIFIPIAMIFLWDRQMKKLILVSFMAFLIFSPQLIFNNIVFGGFFQSGYTSLSAVPSGGLFNINYPLSSIGRGFERLGFLMLLLIISCFALLISGTIFLWHKFKVGAFLTALWII
ncbi:MAG: hypothetical protein Q7S14_03640, partial [bacterium]|nr:hypothetical protein [bacterium]